LVNRSKMPKKDNDIIARKLSEIQPIPSAHFKGEKVVFLNNEESVSAVTQVAIAKFLPGDSVEMHSHYDMEEVFYILEGEGVFVVDDKEIPCTPGTFVKIPAQVPHRMINKGKGIFSFFYYGIEV